MLSGLKTLKGHETTLGFCLIGEEFRKLICGKRFMRKIRSWNHLKRLGQVTDPSKQTLENSRGSSRRKSPTMLSFYLFRDKSNSAQGVRQLKEFVIRRFDLPTGDTGNDPAKNWVQATELNEKTGDFFR
jgi:hypothetical protein